MLLRAEASAFLEAAAAKGSTAATGNPDLALAWITAVGCAELACARGARPGQQLHGA